MYVSGNPAISIIPRKSSLPRAWLGPENIYRSSFNSLELYIIYVQLWLLLHTTVGTRNFARIYEKTCRYRYWDIKRDESERKRDGEESGPWHAREGTKQITLLLLPWTAVLALESQSRFSILYDCLLDPLIPRLN